LQEKVIHFEYLQVNESHFHAIKRATKKKRKECAVNSF